jgi:type IV pilus assembly protein PilP
MITRRWVVIGIAVTSLAHVSHAQTAPAALETESEFAPRPSPEGLAYDATGKRDPFRPFVLDLREVSPQREPPTPLQRFDVGQLTVVGIVLEISPPRAVIEDNVGMGYIVTIGTPIGRNNGVVKAIEPGKVVVEERVMDFYGQEQASEVVMALPTDVSTTKGRERQ